jgi:hypothetical protein
LKVKRTDIKYKFLKTNAIIVFGEIYKMERNCAVQVREMGIENETSLATRQVNKPVR